MTGSTFSSLTWLAPAAAGGTAAAVSFPVLAGSVFLGSVVPVIPTGPIVAAAAALGQATSGLSLLLVVVLATAAAFAGDLVTFAVCRGQGSRALDWLVRRHDSERVRWARDRVSRNASRLIVVGRILPAGRIPVLLAAGALRYPWKAFLPVGAAAALLWAVLYAAVGVAGGALFDSPIVAVAAAVLLAVLVTAGPALYRLVRRRTGAPAGSRSPHPRPPDTQSVPAPEGATACQSGPQE